MNSRNSHPIEVLRDYLFKLVAEEGSDLHIKSNATVRARIRGDVVVMSAENIPPETILGMAQELAGGRFEEFTRIQEFDTVYVLDEVNRFRVNLFYHLEGIAIVLRLIPHEIKSFEALNLPAELEALTKLNRGLVLVTGTTGSGKSTTLATIIETINKERRKHVVTIEDPVEFAHSDKQSIIEQRGIGQHTQSFTNALRSAMREDPGIIVVGEMRDVETAESVLQAVNTGHLVFSTLHTLDARETIDRLIAIFPEREQNRIRMNLASNLQAVVSQRLIRGKEGGLVPAVEMMFRSPRIEYMIRSMRDNEIPDAMGEERYSFGSVTFNTALFELCLADKITEEEAYNYATSASDLKLMFTKSPEYNEKLKVDGKIDLNDMVEIKEEEEEEEENGK
ncbi:MAG: PilT/PilU family type 4a pilus ATPase [Campylobacterota bacterium]|nr:PilT/PilU family type 4a pilus ATPase [Campylobacterota bacterium]